MVYLQDFSLNASQDVWQNQTAHQSIELFEFDLHIFAPTTEVTGKTIVEPEGEIEGISMTIYVRTSSGKTISMKCTRKQKVATISDEVERRSSIPRGMMHLVHHGKVLNEKKTIEENNKWSRSYKRNVPENTRRNGKKVS